MLPVSYLGVEAQRTRGRVGWCRALSGILQQTHQTDTLNFVVRALIIISHTHKRNPEKAISLNLEHFIPDTILKSFLSKGSFSEGGQKSQCQSAL